MQLIEYIRTLSDTQLIFGPAFFLLGVISLVIVVKRRQRAKESEKWPFVEGVIMHLYLSSMSHSSRNSSYDVPNVPTSDIRYYYIVHGRKFEGTKVAIVDTDPAAYVQQFKEGNKVKVYFDPDKPSRSLLITGCPTGYCSMTIGLSVIVIPFFLVSAGIFIFG